MLDGPRLLQQAVNCRKEFRPRNIDSARNSNAQGDGERGEGGEGGTGRDGGLDEPVEHSESIARFQAQLRVRESERSGGLAWARGSVGE